jgi:GNAT superfamily N-acetyltransferase
VTALRPAGPADAEAIEAVRAAAWTTAYRGLAPDSFLDRFGGDLTARRRELGEPGLVQLVAPVGGALAGWVAAGPARDHDLDAQSTGEIYACYVRPQDWGRGVGRALLAAALAALAGTGRGRVSLWVLRDNAPARRFYALFDFRPDGREQLLDLDGPVWEVRCQRAGGGSPAERATGIDLGVAASPPPAT